MCATSSALNTVDEELAGPATNGGGKMLVNVLSIVRTNELMALKESSMRKSKFQHFDSSSCASGRNLMFISSETFCHFTFKKNMF